MVIPIVDPEISRGGGTTPQMPLSCQKRQMPLTVKTFKRNECITRKRLKYGLFTEKYDVIEYMEKILYDVLRSGLYFTFLSLSVFLCVFLEMFLKYFHERGHQKICLFS